MVELTAADAVKRPCPLCGSTDESRVFCESNVDFDALDAFAFASRKIPEFMHHRLVLCPACDVLYASPVPQKEVLLKAYERADFDSADEASYAGRTYGGFLPEIIKQIPDKEGALDIGTGNGAFLEELLKQGFENVAGVEPSLAPAKAAKNEIRPFIKIGPFNAGDFTGNSFSLITCFQTLEHLSDPLQTCRDIHKLLKKGGAFFVVSHDHRSFLAKLLGKRSPIFDIEHLQLFSRKSIETLLIRSGLRNVRSQLVVNRYPLNYWIRLSPLAPPLKRAGLSILKKTRAGGWPVSILVGNIAAIGYKK